MPKLNWKKIIIVLIFLAFCAGIAYLMYYLFFKTPAPVTEKTPIGEFGKLPEGQEGQQGEIKPGEETLPGGQTPGEPTIKIPATTGSLGDEIAQGNITKVKDLDYKLTTNITLADGGDKLISYNPEEGKFYTLKDDGTKELLSNRVYKNVENIAWAGNKEKAILEFPDGTNVLYDFKNDKQINLPTNWTSFSFSTNSNQIAFKDMNPYRDYRFVSVANPDGSGQKLLEFMGDNAENFKVDWAPNSKIVATVFEGDNAEQNKVLFVGQNKENFTGLMVNGFDFEYKWTPDGNRLIYSAANQFSKFRPVLYVVNAYGANVSSGHTSLGVSTWADKCTFGDANTLYCAVPKDMPQFANADEENLKKELFDDIYKIDIKNGSKQLLAKPDVDYSVDQIVLSADGSKLFFTDNNIHAVHEIKLK